MQGGYIWDWVDQALVDSRDSSRTLCYGGDFDKYAEELARNKHKCASARDAGDVGDAQFCINGLIFADRTPHPALQELWYLQSPIQLTLTKIPTMLQRNLHGRNPALQKKYTLTITNRYRFLSLEHVHFKWSITTRQKVVVREGILDMSTMTHQEDADPTFMPGGQYRGPMPFAEHDIKKLRDKYGIRLYLNIRVELHHQEPEQCNRSPQQNALIVSDSFALFNTDEFKMFTNAKECLNNFMFDTGPARVSLLEYKIGRPVFDRLVVQGKDYTVAFEKDSGKFLHMHGDNFLTEKFQSSSNTPLIVGCNHAFYRAATDNDKGGLSEAAVGGTTMQVLTWIDRVCGTSLTSEGPSASSFNAQWLKCGLDDVETVRVEPINVIQDHIVVQKEKIMSSVSTEPLFLVQTTWTFYATYYTMDVEVVAGTGLPTTLFSLPRIGMHFELPANYTHVQYEGRGPHECYADRKRSNPQGIWDVTVEDCHVPYVVPSENGGRCDVTSLTVRSDSRDNGEVSEEATLKSALKITYETTEIDDIDEQHKEHKEQPLTGPGHAGGPARKRPAGVEGAQMNVSRYSVAELNRAKHDDELLGRGAVGRGLPSNRPIECLAEKTVHLHVDTAHMGVGGDTGWTPATHVQYRISGVPGTVWKYRLKVEVVS